VLLLFRFTLLGVQLPASLFAEFTALLVLNSPAGIIARSDEEFEAYLLELLSDFQITIPEIGTISAKEPPIVIITSNRTREIHDALRRRFGCGGNFGHRRSHLLPVPILGNRHRIPLLEMSEVRVQMRRPQLRL
jgi:hypothetical protein